MFRRLGWVCVGVWVVACTVSMAAQTGKPAWKIPPGAEKEVNPLPPGEAVEAAGKKVFVAKCQRCHGPQGKGDGVDADPDLKKDLDLTRADRASANPDGVMFYKISNGRTEPKMPTFADQLSKEQIWAVITYAKTLRAK